ncbi:MAG: SAM-dependent methyltransferase, partial [Mycobacteriales bacterium]
MGEHSWIPEKVDPDLPNPARMYDYYLGGAHNFAADRELAQRALAAQPALARAAQCNRHFLGRVVRYSIGAGIDQFLDLGSGIPTAGNVHQVAQQQSPLARVAYVDNESVAVAHSAELLLNNPNASITHADLRDVDAVLSAPGVAGLLDFSRPIALLTV